MKSSVSSLGRSAQKIVFRIQQVKEAAEKAAKSGKRFAHYRYLRAVFSAYRYFEDNGLLSPLAEIAPSTLFAPVRANSSPLRVIIEATCVQPDLKTRSRWTRALEYAVAEKIDPNDLVRFIRAHNGVVGCADLASKTKVKTPPTRQ